jgi:F-type H+-transporting ATPase subunit epsilon
MSGFAVHVLSPRASERLEDIEAFVGEDASGQFGLRAHHERFITVLVPGLSRLRHADGHTEYLAQSGAVAQFADNGLVLACRDYIRGPDAQALGVALEERMAAEEQVLREAHEHLEHLEREMLRRLWQLQKEARR